MQYKILENNRIASKGYAMLTRMQNLRPLSLVVMLLAIMIF
ncbi:oxidoreductase, zinc-binding dehydrogenase family [Campylobacter jejuni subsp. doylei]|uniref:Oxidoreductase, zinc-binding dehydrogenase family n=1 Tax=Campylobacter jejuni subsp. doylei TaxID=32021 RepID=A0A448JCD3_CAMJU|nr:oxidoreductase, zinc-binding dehydrogenase family [Campylobacter jejuni subsp. doylei]